MPSSSTLPTRVAIIGGGLAGLCAAKACASRGLSVTVFDSRPQLGGLWTPPSSPVFDALTTNTGCFETCLSDVSPSRVTPSPHLSPNDNLCNTASELREYIATVARHPELRTVTVRSEVNVQAVRPRPDGYDVSYVPLPKPDLPHPEPTHQPFDYVIIASGKHTTPSFPPRADFPGLDTFSGQVLHACQYKNPAQLRGQRVLVIGGSISGCELAGDLAMANPADAPAQVTLSTRCMHHLAVKQSQGHVLISSMSTRFLALQLLAGMLDADAFTEALHPLNHIFNINDEINAPPCHGPIYVGNRPNFVVVNQRVISGTKNGTLSWNVGGVRRLQPDGSVDFKDGTSSKYDVVVFATGYRLHMPFLDDDTKKIVVSEDDPDHALDLANFSFHPEFPRLAFMALYRPGSASAPMFDNQARWIAKVIAQPETKPSNSELRRLTKIARTKRITGRKSKEIYGFEILDLFARLGGFEVDLSVHKEWTKALLFAPYVPAQFRLFGDGKTKEAFEEFERQMSGAGFEKGDNTVDPKTLSRLEQITNVLVAQGKGPGGLREAVDYLMQVNRD